MINKNKIISVLCTFLLLFALITPVIGADDKATNEKPSKIIDFLHNHMYHPADDRFHIDDFLHIDNLFHNVYNSEDALSRSSLKEYNTFTITVNEYDMMQNIVSKTDLELIESGFSDEEIKEVRSFNDTYLTHLKKLTTYTDKQLIEEIGYTREQVRLLRSFDAVSANSAVSADSADPEIMRALSANLTFGASIPAYLTQQGNDLHATINISWVWSQAPVWKFNDTIGVSYYGYPYNVDINTSGSNTLVDYDMGSYGVFYWGYPISIATNGTGAYSTFPMVRLYNSSATITGWAKAGSSTIKMKFPLLNNSSQYINLTIGYVHQTVNFNISIGFGTSGLGISVSPSLYADVINGGQYKINKP
jgi:hypothetical protein